MALGTEPISKLLLRFATPAIIAMTASSLYNMVDSIFIGNGPNCGPLAIAGLATTFPLMNLSAAFGAMVGIGASSVISVKMGQRDIESAEKAMGNVVILNVLIGSIFMALALIFLDPILMFFGASENTLPFAREYMSVLLWGNVLTHLYLGLNDVVRSSGYPKRAMAATLTAVGINVIFNYLFIFVAELGIAGAAIGTLCSQFVAFCMIVVHFTRKDTFLKFKRQVFVFQKKIAFSILSIGCAPFLTNFCACVVVLLINNGLKDYGGDMYVGAYGIANRVIFVFFMVVGGLNQGMQPICGYNYGAGQVNRSFKAFKITVTCAVLVMTVCLLSCEFLPEFIVSWFTTDPELIRITSHALQIMAAVAPCIGFQVVTIGLFTSFGMAKKSILISLTRQLLFLIPFLVILPRYFGTDGVWCSMPMADLTSFTLSIILIVRLIRKFRQKE